MGEWDCPAPKRGLGDVFYHTFASSPCLIRIHPRRLCVAVAVVPCAHEQESHATRTLSLTLCLLAQRQVSLARSNWSVFPSLLLELVHPRRTHAHASSMIETSKDLSVRSFLSTGGTRPSLTPLLPLEPPLSPAALDPPHYPHAYGSHRNAPSSSILRRSRDLVSVRERGRIRCGLLGGKEERRGGSGWVAFVRLLLWEGRAGGRFRVGHLNTSERTHRARGGGRSSTCTARGGHSS